MSDLIPWQSSPYPNEPHRRTEERPVDELLLQPCAASQRQQQMREQLALHTLQLIEQTIAEARMLHVGQRTRLQGQLEAVAAELALQAIKTQIQVFEAACAAPDTATRDEKGASR